MPTFVLPCLRAPTNSGFLVFWTVALLTTLRLWLIWDFGLVKEIGFRYISSVNHLHPSLLEVCSRCHLNINLFNMRNSGVCPSIMTSLIIISFMFCLLCFLVSFSVFNLLILKRCFSQGQSFCFAISGFSCLEQAKVGSFEYFETHDLVTFQRV